MVATAPAVRRALAGALLASCVLAAALLAWLGRSGDAARPQDELLPAPAPAVLREPAAPEPQAPGEQPEPEPAADAPGAIDEPEPQARRAAREPGPAGTGGLRVDIENMPKGRLFVGRGGSLPLDAPAAAASAELAGGFVRDCGPVREVSPIAPGPLRVLLAEPGGRRVEIDGLWVLADETLLVVAPGPRTVPLTLRVVGPNGVPLVGARVAFAGDRPGGARDALGPGAASVVAVTGADGVAFVTPRVGAWRLHVSAFGSASDVLAPYVLDGESWLEDEPRAIEIELAHGVQIAGDVLDPDGLGFAQRRVAAWSAIGPGPTPEEALALGLPVAALATVAGADVTPEGRFAFRGLARDAVLELRALVDSDLAHADGFALPVRARAGDRRVSVTQRAGAALELEVLAGDTPAPLASFTAELPGTWPGRARDGRDGKLLWSGLRPYGRAEDATFADLPESPDLELGVLADGYDLARPPLLRLRTGETTRAPRIVLRPLPAVHVRVVDALDGAPIEGAVCELAALLPDLAVGRTWSAGVSDAAGRARLTATAENASELVVRCAGYAPLRLRAPAPNLPEGPLELALARGASVRARVIDAEGLPVRALVLRRRTAVETGDAFAVEHERALSDADGRVEFRDLEAGPVALAACELARSDLELAPPIVRMAWTSVGVTQGGTAEVELGALPAPEVDLRLTWQGRKLPGAVLRLSAERAAFSAPHDDARTFLSGPAVRADHEGLVRLGPLHAGSYALRVEHPFVPGFARTLLVVDGFRGPRALELASEHLHGEVLRDGELAGAGRVVVWAHGPYHERGLVVEPGARLRELAPEPIFLGEAELAGGGFSLPVPSGVELIVTAHDGEASGDYYVAVPEGPRGSISVSIEPSLTLELVSDLRGKRSRTRALGLVGYNLGQPWGRGLIAMPLERHEITIGDLPRGTWRLCLVELAGGQLVLERGDWSEYQLAGGRQRVRVDWRRR